MYKKFDSLNFINFCIAFMGISSKITETELKSPKGVSMILDCENCIRAVCHCTEANNKYMYNYDESTENSYFVYADFNNQNKWDLSEPLIFGRLENVEYIKKHKPKKTET